MERTNTIAKRDSTALSLIKIKGYIPVSMLDWDGSLATTIFIGGCNLNCPYCHNYQLAQNPDQFLDVDWDEIHN